MEVQNKLELERFMRKHPNARAAIERWLDFAEAANWRRFEDVRATFGSVDGGVLTGSGKRVEVFNVHGNDYRLITKIVYDKQLVLVLGIMSHDDYRGNHWKKRM